MELLYNACHSSASSAHSSNNVHRRWRMTHARVMATKRTLCWKYHGRKKNCTKNSSETSAKSLSSVCVFYNKYVSQLNFAKLKKKSFDKKNVSISEQNLRNHNKASEKNKVWLYKSFITKTMNTRKNLRKKTWYFFFLGKRQQCEAIKMLSVYVLPIYL